MTKSILLTNGSETIVDDELYNYLITFGNFKIDDKGYVKATNHRKYPYRLHRYVMQFKDISIANLEIHHINGDKLDNRFENLKVVSASDHAIIENRFDRIYNPVGYWKDKSNPHQRIRMSHNNPMKREDVKVKFSGINNPKYKSVELEYIKQCKYIDGLNAKDTAIKCNFSVSGFSRMLKSRFGISWKEI